MQGMEQCLLSCFKWGLFVDFSVLDFEICIVIMEKKMYGNGIDFLCEVVEYLVYSININVCEMEGVLIFFLVQVLLNKKVIIFDFVK